MSEIAMVRPGREVAERAALRSLLRLAYSLTREQGDVYVGRRDLASGGIRLEAWAREVDVATAEVRIPPALRAAAETAALDLYAHLEVDTDRPERRIVFRIDA